MTLAAVDASVDYEGSTVLNGVSLTVEPGEVVGLVGPSGTGKTTLLRLLAGFRAPDAGTVAWDGQDVWTLPEADRRSIRRQVSMVFQEPTLFNTTVRRNVSYGLRVRRSWWDRLAARLRGGEPERTPPAVHEALATVGLEHVADRNALSVSGGEAQRVAFARALAPDPSVMLLDEPASDLDPGNTAVLEAAVRRARTRGVGVLLATHDMQQAERVSDRVGVILGGELVEVGPPDQVFEAPTDPRTARFVAGELPYDGARRQARPPTTGGE